ncbi:cytochrome P450 [Streptomyces sp. NPDC017202]|uniref:cytochrome P450 n=1 Tax=Streptomyces sp. NPDC017202 TaxID=3364981 RepID=UPI00378EA5AD
MAEPAPDAGSTAFPIIRECPFKPPAEYSAIRAESPITRVSLTGGRTAWLITKHEYVRQLLGDPRASSDPMRPGFPSLVEGQQAVDKKGVLPWLDPPEHTTYRRTVVSEFTFRRVKSMRPYIQEVVDECVDAMLSGPRPTDLVQQLSLVLPSLVICELLGVPYADRDMFQKRARTVVSRTATAEEWADNLGGMRVYLGELVDAKADTPEEEDLLSKLVVRFDENGLTDREHLVGLALLLLIAGFETTASLISLSAVSLLTHPEQLALFKADPSVAPAAVEELLRFVSHADHVTNRVATADIELPDGVIREGEGMLLSTAAANHDPDVFEHPDRLDLRREGRPGHLAFGYGIHQCLGQNLARLEVEVALSTLFTRIPDLRLAVPVEDLPFTRETLIYGYDSVPVTW